MIETPSEQVGVVFPIRKCPMTLIQQPHSEHTFIQANTEDALAFCSGFKKTRRPPRRPVRKIRKKEGGW